MMSQTIPTSCQAPRPIDSCNDAKALMASDDVIQHPGRRRQVMGTPGHVYRNIAPSGGTSPPDRAEVTRADARQAFAAANCPEAAGKAASHAEPSPFGSPGKGLCLPPACRCSRVEDFA